MTIQASRFSRARNRRALRSAIRSVVEPLEPRTLFAGNLLYLNDNWQITTNVGPGGLSAGDTVSNSADDGSLHDLTFGTNAFNSISSAIAAATAGDTIVFVSGSYSTFDEHIFKGLNFQGWPSFASAYASPAANPDPTHLTQGLLNGTLTTSLSNVKFNLATAGTVSISGFRFINYDHNGAVNATANNQSLVNIQGNVFNVLNSSAIGVLFSAGKGIITNNTFSGSVAVSLQGGSATVSGNQITIPFEGRGVVVAGGSAIAITSNTITSSAPSLAGITLSDHGVFAGNLNVIISANSISGAAVGIGVDGQSEPAAATISGNTLIGNSTGILLQGNSSSASIAGNLFASATTAIDVQGGAAVINGNSISSSTIGILFENAIGGGPASGTLTGNRFSISSPNATDLDIAAAPALVFGGGNYFGATSYFINNESPDDFTLTHEIFGTRNATTVADKIVDKDDDGSLGEIHYSLNLTINTFLQNRTVLHTGDSLNIQGTYSDQAVAGPHQIHIDWGDGTSPQTLPINGGSFSLFHPYNSTGSDSISAYLIASDGATSSVALGAVTVLDTPVLNASLDRTIINQGGTIVLSGDISDPGPHTFTLNVNWGNSVQGVALGTVPFNFLGISWDPVTRHFTLPHTYSNVIPNGSTASVFNVTATVTDDSGGLSNLFASPVSVYNAPPRNVAISIGSTNPAAISTGSNSATVYEATAISLNGSYEDPGALTPNTFNWHVTSNNGQVITDGTAQNFSFTPVQNGTGGNNASYSVVYTVTDSTTGSTASTPFVFTVSNKAPTIDLSASPTSTTVGANYTLSLGAITDPGTLDVITGYKINWGDGTIEDHTGGGAPPATRSHVYATASTNYAVSVALIDNDGTHNAAGTLNLTVTGGGSGTVVGRRLFYKGSSFDVGGHDNAIASDKNALLPGQTAASANYSSYALGINGIMVDISGSPAGLTASDFAFATGNDDSPEFWTPLGAAPSITVRPGAGAGGSTRVEITFTDGAIAGKWLQVTVHPTPQTGLGAPDIFYFGSAIGEVGDSAASAKVNATDQLTARFGATLSASITNPSDFNRDGKVDSLDEGIARANGTYFANELHLIHPPALGGSANLLGALPMGPMSPPSSSKTPPAATAAQAVTVTSTTQLTLGSSSPSAAGSSSERPAKQRIKLTLTKLGVALKTLRHALR